MTLSTEIQHCTECSQVPAPENICSWADRAFSAVASRDAEVTIRIVDESECTTLNETYRGGSGPTNVLSFTYADNPYTPQDTLGDVVICAPVVRREAVSQNKAVDAHWAHMVVHGILHLCGFDHGRDQDARVMENLETKILSDLGFSAPYN